jgi:type I restriction enzyme S subunit
VISKKAYPKYKPSGVEWLGDVPEHWEIVKLKYVCRFMYGDPLSVEDREDGIYSVYGSNGPIGTHVVSTPRIREPLFEKV